MTGKVYVLDGPAAVGKSRFAERLLADEELGLHFCPRLTSRAPREGDHEYSYVSEEEFERMVAEGEFASYRVFLYGSSYGVPKKPIEERRQKGEHSLVIVDLGTAEQIKEVWPDAVTIFLISPVEEIEKRLRQGEGSDKQISEKLQNASNSFSLAPYYDYVVPNRQGRDQEAYAQIRRIIVANR